MPVHSLRSLFWLLLGIGIWNACMGSRKLPQEDNPLTAILQRLRQDPLARQVLDSAERSSVQILYTQIDRRRDGSPLFRTYGFRVDSTRYFYPASMVKMPLALLALEKVHRLRRSGYPMLSPNTPYCIDSLRPFQQAYCADSTAPTGLPTLAHDIRRVFVVSDNPSYNHLFDFLGIDYINQTLREKGYTRTGIVHRFYAPRRDQRYASPMTFYSPEGSVVIYREAEKVGQQLWVNPQNGTRQGKGWVDAEGRLVEEPFDMSGKNWFALTDMEQMLRSILFPAAVPAQHRFDLSKEDYRFVWKYMGLFPRECDAPSYDPRQYPDDFVKYYLFSDSTGKPPASLRIFNKVGQAYGTLTDVAYIVDFDTGVEFILAATILCNDDGIFNDDQYEYETVGRPFLAKLAQAAYHYERTRKRGRIPDLSSFREALR